MGKERLRRALKKLLEVRRNINFVDYVLLQFQKAGRKLAVQVRLLMLMSSKKSK